jgi:hypothetical protein
MRVVTGHTRLSYNRGVCIAIVRADAFDFHLPPAHGEEDDMSPQLQRVVVILLVIGLVAIASGTLHSHEMRASYLAAAGVALLLSSSWLWWSSGALLWRKRRAGVVLLDLGRRRSDRAASAAGVVLSLGFAVWALRTPELHNPALALGYVVFAAYVLLHSLLASLSKVQLRARGIALPSQYVPWERIGSYELHDGTTHTEVAIQYRTWLTFSGYPWELTLRCPMERREVLEAIMARYVPPWRKIRFFPSGMR